MSENLQERPAFCDTPGLSKTSALASQCKPDSMGQVKPDRPDIRSKALTDTDEKKKRLQKLGLTHKETYQKFFNRIRGVDVDESTKEYAKSLEKIANDRALKMLSKSERENLKKIAVLLAKEEFYIDEANLNDYVKKFKMKMGDKTSTADKDAWVDGIGGLTKREKTTLKRVLEEVEIVEDSRDKSKPDPKGRKHPEIKKDSEKAIALLKKKGIPAKYGNSMYFGDRIYVQRDMEAKAKKIVPKDLHQYVFGTIDNPVQAGFRTNEEVEVDEDKNALELIKSLKRPQYSIKNTKTGQNYSSSRYQDDKKLDKIRKGGGDHKHAAHYKDGKMVDEYVGTIKKRESVKKHGYPNQNPKKDKYTGYVEGNKKTFAELRDKVNEVDSSGIDMYDHKRKESEMRKKARAVPTTPETLAKLKKARAGEVVDEISTGLLNRAAGAAKKDAATQRDAQDWATRVKGKGHAFGADEAGKKAAKREKQAGKFSAAVDVKQRDTAFKKEDVIDEKESDYADKIAAFKKKGGKVEKQPDGPISKSLFRTTVGREKRRNPGKQATRGTFYDEVEVKELGPVGAFIAKKAIKHIAKKAVEKVTSKNEMMARSVGSQKKTRDKLFLAKSRDKTNSVNELSKDLLQRAGQAAKKKAGQQRAVSDRAASRVGDTSQPPGQNLKSKRADYQAAKKDYQAFKFDRAAKKKIDESNKLQANMALDDAGIKSYWEDGKLWVDKKDVVKAEKTLAKSFKKGGEPHIYYKGGFLGVWNKKRKLTG